MSIETRRANGQASTVDPRSIGLHEPDLAAHDWKRFFKWAWMTPYSKLKWLDEYSGQPIADLVALETEYRPDSLVLMVHQALDQKAFREGDSALSREERFVAAVVALVTEVNDGGYAQFFHNYAGEFALEFAPILVQALADIGCPRTGKITERAIAALHLAHPNAEAIEFALADDKIIEELNRCDEFYFKAMEDIFAALFAFIKANKDAITL